MDILVSGSMAYDRIMNFNGRFSDHILPDQLDNINVSFAVEKPERELRRHSGQHRILPVLAGREASNRGNNG